MAASEFFPFLQQHLAYVCAFATLKHTHRIVEMHKKFSVGANFAIKSLQKGIFSQNFEVEVKTYSILTNLIF